MTVLLVAGRDHRRHPYTNGSDCNKVNRNRGKKDKHYITTAEKLYNSDQIF